MISVPEAATLPINSLPVLSERARTTSSGNPAGKVRYGCPSTIPAISQCPVIVSLAGEAVMPRPKAPIGGVDETSLR